MAKNNGKGLSYGIIVVILVIVWISLLIASKFIPSAPKTPITLPSEGKVIAKFPGGE